MRKAMIVSLLMVAFIQIHSLCFGQADVSVLTARVGAIRSETITSHGNYLWSFYPEIEIGGGLFVQCLSWGISWGYWTDGTVEAEPVADFVQYSVHGHVLSGRVGIMVQSIATHFPIPLAISAGVAHIFSESTYIGEGAPWIGLAKYTEQTTVGLLGLAVPVPVSSKMEVNVQVVQFVPFGDKRSDNSQTNRRVFTLGLTLFL